MKKAGTAVKNNFRTAAAIAITMLGLTQTAFAQEIGTAYVPFIVNADATVKAERENAAPILINVSANTEDTLKIPIGGTVSVRQRAQNTLNSTPVITHNQRGNVSLYLPGQSYHNAEVSLYSVNGRRVLRTNANAGASQTANNISRPNLVAGVYLMSVTGINGQNFSSRLTHRGGKLNINVSFGGENFAPVSPAAMALSRQAMVDDSGEWTITVSADGYADSSYAMDVVVGMNPLQTITLSPANGTFVDERDGQEYRWVRIGEQIWMAENLNWAGDDNNLGWCYGNNSGNCDVYGRLYDWSTVMELPSSCNSSSCANQVQSRHRGICPVGWHVPSDDEWEILVKYVDPNATGNFGNIAGARLKSVTGWLDGDTWYVPGTDDFGFSALPGGGSGDFHNAGYRGYWWNATEYDYHAGYAGVRYMYYHLSVVNKYADVKTYLFSLRCLRYDPPGFL
jgi:uncharacterized protein (TIGR02145 family)